MAPVNLLALARRQASSLVFDHWPYANFTALPSPTTVPAQIPADPLISVVTLGDHNGTISAMSNTQSPPGSSTVATGTPSTSIMHPTSRPFHSGSTTRFTAVTATKAPSLSTALITNATAPFMAETSATLSVPPLTGTITHSTTVTRTLSPSTKSTYPNTTRGTTTVTITQLPTPTIFTTKETITWFPPPSTTTITKLVALNTVSTAVPLAATPIPPLDLSHSSSSSKDNNTSQSSAPSLVVTSIPLITSLHGTSSTIAPSTDLPTSSYIIVGPFSSSLSSTTSFSLSLSLSSSSYSPPTEHTTSSTLSFLTYTAIPTPSATKHYSSILSYPTNPTTPASSATANAEKAQATDKYVSTIIGSVGGVVVFALGTYAAYLWWKHKKSKKNTEKAEKAKNKGLGSTAAASCRRPSRVSRASRASMASWMSGVLRRRGSPEGGEMR